MKQKLEDCFHCGNDCLPKDTIFYDEKNFCCNGCKTVYELFTENELTSYYEFEKSPGKIPEVNTGKYDYLENTEIVKKLLEFESDSTSIITLNIPHIHCSSCIWILENIHKLNPKIQSAQVNFPKKTVRIIFDKNIISLKEIVTLLASIGYEPYISLEDTSKSNKNKTDNSLIYKLGVAGFAFGNIMFLSFPEYFEVDEFWLNQYKPFFRWIMFFMSLPVLLYASQDYLISAYKGLKHKILNIDVPIALGILVLFGRSCIEIFLDLGQGYFDSLSGLVFFLLLGKFFQQRTYSFLSFERDYKSYFPIAVTKIEGKTETPIQIYDVQKGDRLLIRNQELIPIDGIIIKGDALIDYSFVTGEANPVTKKSGDKIFAGGKQTAGVLEIEAIKTVSQSYLTQLWSNDVFNKNKEDKYKNITDRISKYFTIVIITLSLIAGIYWYFIDKNTALNVVSSILIIACPCALALSAPFTLGNMIRIFGRHKFYLKNATVIENLAKINTLVFDKTGTITQAEKLKINYIGENLTVEDYTAIKTILRNSNHPLSRNVYDYLEDVTLLHNLDNFKETVGQGIEAAVDDKHYKIGAATFAYYKGENSPIETAVHIAINDTHKGKFILKNSYRRGIFQMFENLTKKYKLTILSGDNNGEKKYLENNLPDETQLIFDQKPDDKLKYIERKQRANAFVMMFGDGLNDAGALAQSNVGVAVSENVNVFSPACDAIIDAKVLKKIPLFLKLAKQSIQIIKASFILSFLYNIIGLYFAITGKLSPIIAAILMPLSSISVVSFVTLLTNSVGKKLNTKN